MVREVSARGNWGRIGAELVAILDDFEQIDGLFGCKWSNVRSSITRTEKRWR
jgi:hypothetical protein